MPFGLTNAPATFQACMNRIFFKQIRRFVLVFFDDILIYSKTWEEHLQHLEIVLKTLQEQSLYAKMSKCEFGMKELLYLGHIIGKDGVKVHMENIRAILEWPSPKNITELRGFIGICTYYRKFVKGFSKLTSPLTDLTKKDAFKWNEEVENSFQKIKEVMSSFTKQALLDFSKPFVVECDASGGGIGVVLKQGQHPIAFESRKLKPHEKIYSIYEK